MDPVEPPDAVEAVWRDVLADADDTAAEYRSAGHRTLRVTPGAVRVREESPFGIEVVVPTEEFEALEAVLASTTFSSSHVYRTTADDVRFYLVVVEGATSRGGPAHLTTPADDGAGGTLLDDEAETAPDADDDRPVTVIVPAFLERTDVARLLERAAEAAVMYTHVTTADGDSRVTFTHQDPDVFR